MSDLHPGVGDDASAARPSASGASPEAHRSTPERPGSRGRRGVVGRASQVWAEDLGRDERAAILSWGAFTGTFAAVRALTHWIRSGHGPRSGGLSVGGQHFHHYNLGIAGLATLGGILVQAEARERVADHPLVPTAYGVSTALIADEAALLLDLKDVYWSRQGRESVDLAVGIIGAGGLALALVPFAQHFRQRSLR